MPISPESERLGPPVQRWNAATSSESGDTRSHDGRLSRLPNARPPTAAPLERRQRLGGQDRTAALERGAAGARPRAQPHLQGTRLRCVCTAPRGPQPEEEATQDRGPSPAPRKGPAVRPNELCARSLRCRPKRRPCIAAACRAAHPDPADPRTTRRSRPGASSRGKAPFGWRPVWVRELREKGLHRRFHQRTHSQAPCPATMPSRSVRQPDLRRRPFTARLSEQPIVPAISTCAA
jgi:hypothetical protein